MKTLKMYESTLAKARENEDRDAFIADICNSPDWKDYESGPNGRAEWAGNIWDAYHKSVKDVADDAGISQRALARRFGIPYRTMEEWGRGFNKCPAYLVIMMQECLGLFTPSDPE